MAKLQASQNPNLKMRFIDDFESLDEDNQEKILKLLFEKGFQVITSAVGDKVTRKDSILLRECKIAEVKGDII